MSRQRVVFATALVVLAGISVSTAAMLDWEDALRGTRRTVAGILAQNICHGIELLPQSGCVVDEVPPRTMCTSGEESRTIEAFPARCIDSYTALRTCEIAWIYEGPRGAARPRTLSCEHCSNERRVAAAAGCIPGMRFRNGRESAFAKWWR